MSSGFNVKDRVRVSKESLPGYPEPMRLGWILDVIESDTGAVSYEVAVSLPSTRGTKLALPADQIELVNPATWSPPLHVERESKVRALWAGGSSD